MPLTERDRRTLKIGGIVVGVLLLGFFLFNMLAGGGEEPLPDIDPAPSDGTPLPSDEPSLTPTVQPTQVAVFTGRDPFSVPPILSPTASGSTTTTSTSTNTNTNTNTSTNTSTNTQTNTNTQTPPGGTNQGGDTIVLIDTFTLNGTQRAQVEVNGTVYDVAVGQTFGPGGRYRLRSVAGNCATISRGDESFTLCVGDNK